MVVPWPETCHSCNCVSELPPPHGRVSQPFDIGNPENQFSYWGGYMRGSAPSDDRDHVSGDVCGSAPTDDRNRVKRNECGSAPTDDRDRVKDFVIQYRSMLYATSISMCWQYPPPPDGQCPKRTPSVRDVDIGVLVESAAPRRLRLQWCRLPANPKIPNNVN